ncbi:MULTISPECIES: CHAT domain-containing protein [Streptomyces]|nr:CHAT domain-containing protein [Streptomyces sp. SID7813]TYP07939.1 CHAT domain-containing protein [Streptomyces coelicolor]TYP09825.1 CHAT domain-containing protein [Streptomyces coelicolor A3(2)]TYP30283.1 CHAT domain-containing protein [Streptomyces coelicolor]TYP34115.1 CHAT domain-containing protein [Streptomyces coelicolor]TYP51491.1 CHAT domain-containing protein [Streptomyces coelicolor]
MVFAAPGEALTRAEELLGADPSPLHASVAHQVIGIWQRDFGDTRRALAHLRRARDLAARADSAEREADVLATLGVALVHAGRTRAGLEAFERGVARGSGHTRARVLFRRAYVWWVLGRHGEALEDVRRAIPVLRQAEDVIWTARALTLRATVHLALGSVERADADFTAAEALWDTTGQEHDKADAVESRGLAAFRSGDVPAALRLLDEAEERYGKLGTPTFMLTIRRCEVLMAAGLATEALAEADGAVAALDGIGGQSTRKAELLLVAARAARLAGEPQTALARAAVAVRLFAGQRRTWYETHARLVLIEARVATGRGSGRLVADAAAVAERLAAFGAPAAPEASLLAGRIALDLGWTADAERHLAVAARSRHGGPPLARMTGWAAQALRARAAGSARGVLEACRRGLDVLDDHRMTLGASELRARATAQGAELAALAQRASLVSGGPRRLLGWSERWRATVLSAPPTQPPADPVLLTAMTAFRELAARAEEARTDGGRPAPALEREQRRLEREIRSRTLHMRGEAPGDGDRFDVGRLLRRLGDEVRLVELAVLDGRVHVLLCGQGRVRRFEAGLLAEAEVEAEHVQAGLRRLAHPGAEARLPLVEAAGARLQQLLLGPAAAHLGSGPVVVVPPGRLHRVPWALLPVLRDRVLSVSPSASSWLRARDTAPPPGGRQVLVRGPGLASGGAEVPELSERYAGARPGSNGAGSPSPGPPAGAHRPPPGGGRERGGHAEPAGTPSVPPRGERRPGNNGEPAGPRQGPPPAAPDRGGRGEPAGPHRVPASDGPGRGEHPRAAGTPSVPSQAAPDRGEHTPSTGTRRVPSQGGPHRGERGRPAGVLAVPPRGGWERGGRGEPTAADGGGGRASLVVDGVGAGIDGEVVGRVAGAARQARPGAPGAGAAERGRTVVLEGDDARVPGVLRELDGAALAHIAAHGTFRADSPLFSSLRMADGPLIVHDFERLDRSPYRIILPCCDTARFASVGADELLGLVTALLPLGTAGVVACTAPVNDAAVVPLMLALHKGLEAGLSLAEALRDARAALPGDAVHQATGWAFTAFGAA